MYEQILIQRFKEFTRQTCRNLGVHSKLADAIFHTGLPTIKKAAKYRYYMGDGYPTWTDLALEAGFYVGATRVMVSNRLAASSLDPLSREQMIAAGISAYVNESLDVPRVVKISGKLTQQFIYTDLPDELPLPRICPYQWIVFPSGTTGENDFCLFVDVDVDAIGRTVFILSPSAKNDGHVIAVSKVVNDIVRPREIQSSTAIGRLVIILAVQAVLLQASEPEFIHQPQLTKSALVELKKKHGNEARKFKLPIYLASPPIVRESTGSGGGAPTGRTIAPHWRRGHWRRVRVVSNPNRPVGDPSRYGRELEWIQPVLVNADKIPADEPPK